MNDVHLLEVDDMRTTNFFGINNNYYLMNKDNIIARFHVNEFDVIEIDSIEVRLPAWIGNLSEFIANRRAPRKRENIEELLRLSGCDTIKGYLDITHALSLIDTFWVKPVDSLLKWEQVSLYTQDFNEVIAKTAFEGGLHGQGLSSTSPEYGTDGTFAKCWVREDGQIRMLKRGSSGARNAGLEPYSEFYACQIAERFSDKFVKYDLRMRDKRLCSVCDIFTSEKYGYVPYSAFDRVSGSIMGVLNTAKEFGFEQTFREMFVLDAVIMNEDRHKNNFGYLVDNDALEVVGVAPYFDHNMSLLVYADESDFQNIQKYLRRVGPRLYTGDFVTSGRMCLDRNTRKILEELEGFKFERHSLYNLDEWRIDALERVIQQNIRQMLK